MWQSGMQWVRCGCVSTCLYVRSYLNVHVCVCVCVGHRCMTVKDCAVSMLVKRWLRRWGHAESIKRLY